MLRSLVIITSDRSEMNFFFWMCMLDISGDSDPNRSDRPVFTSLIPRQRELSFWKWNQKMRTFLNLSLSIFSRIDWTKRAWNLSKHQKFPSFSHNKLTFMSLLSQKLSELQIWNKSQKYQCVVNWIISSFQINQAGLTSTLFKLT